jgi:hypothetical protein
MRSAFWSLAAAIMILISGTAGRIAAQDEGLLLYLSFDEGAGDTARDSSMYRNNGEINGPKWVEGADGNALEFDGVDDYVEVPYNDMFNINDAITLAAWVKPAMAPFAGEQWRGIINGQKSTHGPYLLQMTGANGEMGAWLGGTWVWQVTTAILDTENFWHLVGTYEDGVGFKDYVNGELDSQNAQQGAIKDNVNEGVVIGHNYSFANRWFQGIIDEAVIYNRALTEDEVRDLYEGNIKAEVIAVNPDGALANTWARIKDAR